MGQQVNREGLTFEEFYDAAAPAGDEHFGYIRTRTKLTPQELSEWYVTQPDGRIIHETPHPVSKYVYGSKTRDPVDVLRRAWSRGEDPTEWRRWALEQRSK